jgi:hypothetical protein
MRWKTTSVNSRKQQVMTNDRECGRKSQNGAVMGGTRNAALFARSEGINTN